ncbi:MAG: response regulator [Deltaproteobacteria bacterium]|nr:response regulator [Deltaproteobacteria bacterium]
MTDPRPQPRVAPLTLRDLSPLHILLIEDNPDIRELMKDLLESGGHRVDDAADGTLGLQQLMAAKPQLALIDIGLPDVDGYALATRARALGSQSALVAMTGHDGVNARQRILGSGFDAHIVKPFVIDLLAPLFHRLCPTPRTA